MIYGKFELLNLEDEQVCMYLKKLIDMEEKLLVILNFFSDFDSFVLLDKFEVLNFNLFILMFILEVIGIKIVVLEVWEGRLYRFI